ncbi:hypothetical protein [Mucilaginibacter flavidus]|uniref:hypothetical protein n=1 Tax=Mucilaginibacter flavidus TaxID=2949309 RepID=UPI0020927E90|nr:hypothetical protein [Mucilaginibacter flavidus]MCO5949086.1 hypothetical protein [Mucilaginibacter flavidus]
MGTATGYDVNVLAPRKYTFAIPAATRGTINYTMTTDLFFSQGSVSVFLKAFDSNNVIVSQKTVVATTGQNKITILSGNLFGGSGGSGGGFVISVPGWSAPITQTF